jgi:chromosome partitioning protein
VTAKIITVINQKGGSSKTTTAMSLSGALGNRGNSVLLVDADEQQTAVRWSKSAPPDSPFPAAVIGMASYGEKLHREVQRQLEKYDFIVIDTPPALAAGAPVSALLIANLAIVPVPPAPADLWAARGVKLLIESVQTINKELSAAVLASRVQRTSLTRAVMQEMKNFGMPLMHAQLSNRTAFQEAVLAGMTVCALGREAKTAAMEVSAMTDEILAILGGSK